MLAPKFKAFCRLFEKSPRGTSFLVALSGGVDSMALALIANDWCREYGYKLVTLTIDHRLREGSAREANAVGKLMQLKKIEHHIIVWEHSAIDSAIQEKARLARYDLIEKFCESHSINYVFLGHHQDDQIETYLMRKERGSSEYGLACMQPIVSRGAITLLRPFLDIPKKEMISFCEERGQKWFEDPSNQKNLYTRNKIRLTQPVDRPTIIKAIHIASIERNRLDKAMLSFVEKHVEVKKVGSFSFDRAAFFSCSKINQLHFLGRLLCLNGPKDYAPKFKQRSLFLERLKVSESYKGTLGGFIVTASKKAVIFSLECRK